MSARNSTDVSHGRGGAGNIGADDTPYGDGEIVREGVVGDHGDGAFSTGRGGAANSECLNRWPVKMLSSFQKRFALHEVQNHIDLSRPQVPLTKLTLLFTVGSPHVKATERKDEVAIPEVALRPSMENDNFHTGRGGEGNVHIAAPTAPKHPEGLADKLKNKLFKKKASKETAAPTS
ncbi:hypothetical protein D0Z07_2763 [Hyphodiscus hymeniophilus]|uniref:Uncharacterized protein n=1 Tax=Hyphodiscus hymeniophilus TaxID=353542 RepID=A0A9P6VN26_9HELO|nr:hypothetical protein D0Z07_2763 [Hyphodiscus hymeniophilus]